MPWADDSDEDSPKKKPIKKRPAKPMSESDISEDDFRPKKSKVRIFLYKTYIYYLWKKIWGW